MTKPMTAGYRNFLVFQAKIESHISRAQKRKQEQDYLVEQQVSRGPVCRALPIRYNQKGVPIPY